MGGLLLVRPTPEIAFDPLQPRSVAALSDDVNVHRRLTARGVTMDPTEDSAADTALLTLDRHRDRARADVARGLRRLRPGGTLLIDGAKTDGVDALLRRIRTHLPLDGVLPKSHGKVAWLTRPAETPAELLAWSRFAAPQQNWSGYVTAPGMFSHEKVDAGTQILADRITGPLSGRIADLGAGWGALTALILPKLAEDAEIELVDTDRAALQVALENTKDPRVKTVWQDVTQLDPDNGAFDTVVSNPPFHEGRAADPTLGVAFIRAAARLLKPKGVLWLVANRHLPYEKTLDAAFRTWEEAGSPGAFKVLRAQAPKRVA
ncbi:MAG: class I SAM-dependent methyltransferase [Pseudomonadota bacterium]